jgi:hypothetical protein
MSIPRPDPFIYGVLVVTIPKAGDPLNVWDTAKQGLINGNVDAALTQFSSASVEHYRSLFLTLGNTELLQSMTAAGTVTPISIDADEAQYCFSAAIDGEQFIFVITFVMENGAWKIEKF